MAEREAGLYKSVKLYAIEWVVDLVFISIYIDKYGFADRVLHFGVGLPFLSHLSLAFSTLFDDPFF